LIRIANTGTVPRKFHLSIIVSTLKHKRPAHLVNMFFAIYYKQLKTAIRPKRCRPKTRIRAASFAFLRPMRYRAAYFRAGTRRPPCRQHPLNHPGGSAPRPHTWEQRPLALQCSILRFDKHRGLLLAGSKKCRASCAKAPAGEQVRPFCSATDRIAHRHSMQRLATLKSSHFCMSTVFGLLLRPALPL
jgi:hypothetical protein